MDENDGGVGFGGYGDGGDTGDQFHRNEAISAVADDGFLGEEDDDYEDLYNDVNVGEGFLQSLRKNEDTSLENRVEPQAAAPRPLPPAVSMAAETGGMSIPGIGGGVEEERKYEGVGGNDGVPRDTGVSVDPYQNQGFKGNDLAPKGPVASVPGTSAGGGPAVGGYGGGGGLRVELSQSSNKVGEIEGHTGNAIVAQGMVQQPPPMSGGNVGSEVVPRPTAGVANMNGSGGNVVVGGSNAISVGTSAGGGGGGTILFVGDLHWWTTDAELEAELVKYGPVKEVKFFDEKASGKSKGYCQVEFYDPNAATACKEGMNGHVFNGRPCVVAFASPVTVKRMGEAQVNRTQGINPQSVPQNRRGPNEPISKPGGSSIATGTNYQTDNNNNNNNNRGYGRGSWGRGNNPGMGGRGPLNPMRNRPMGGRGIMGNGFGQGPPMMHPQTMMAQGFDPAFGPMGRVNTYGGFPGAPTPNFTGMMPSFPPVGSVGMHGVAPHVNPAFFPRGMPMNGMGMMPNTGLDGPNMGMWSDPNMGGWGGDEHGGRVGGESSYGEEAASDQQYGEASHDRTNWQNSVKEKDRGSERDWSGSSERRYRDEREPGYEREMPREKEVTHEQEWPERRHRDEREPVRDRERGDRHSQRDRERSRDRDREHVRERDHDRERERGGDRYREERDRHADHHRYRDREAEYDDDWDRGRSSRTHSKSRVEEVQRSRSRDVDYGKRRRITSE